MHYSSLFKDLEDKRKQIEKDYEEQFVDNFENDKIVVKIKELFSELEHIYGKTNLDLRCKLYSYWDSRKEFQKDKKWNELVEEIGKLRNERALLVAELECNPKNSVEYRKAYDRLQKLFK